MQAVRTSADTSQARRHIERGDRQDPSPVGETGRRSAIELAGALLLALAWVCAAGLNLAGTAQASTQGEAIVRAASSMHGKPYCYDGGNTAGPTHGSGGPGCAGAAKGFDCSGLALYAVFQGTGGKVALPHKASEQAVHGGQRISSQSALLPGDLVFFGGGSMAKAVHVAIYAGHSEVWVAEDYGIPVRTRPLSWITHGLPFDGGVRYWSASSGSPSPAPSNPGSGEVSNTPSPSGSPEPAPGPAPSEPLPSSNPAPQAPTYAETSGSVVHTWTDYSNAGGNEGPEMPSNDTVQIACKLNGFTVADGNTWWYRIASSPWNNAYYGSADAFYNNGATSGSLLGTPFVDPNVPNC
jgi:cell wall-associated NlpC family hydrolase